MDRGTAKIVALVETSGRRQDSGYLPSAEAALQSFLTLLQPGDAFAILHFDRQVYRIFPSSANLEVYGAATAEALSRVEAPAAGEGASLGDAIAIGLDLLRREPEPRALLLFSDGDFDPGPDLPAALDPAIRVYTAAFGEDGGRKLLRDIAGATGGAYLFAPDDIGLASIYFDILEPSEVGRFR